MLAAYKDRVIEISKRDGRIRIMCEGCEKGYIGVLSIAPFHAVVRQNENAESVIFYSNECRQVRCLSIPSEYRVKDLIFNPCRKPDRPELEILLLVTKCGEGMLILRCTVKACEMDLDRCNYEVCNAECSEGKPGQCICDVLESIALVEAALAHMLNAEGEKLQKGVQITDNICDLLELNKSANKMLINVTQLEFLLYSKLQALSDLCVRL